MRDFGLSLLIAASIPVVASLMRSDGAAACALDGQSLRPMVQVRICDSNGENWTFCCIRCAQVWLDRRGGSPTAIGVTDELSGREIDSTQAHYVRSSVVTTPSTGNRIHVFKHESDAAKHVAAFRGKVLLGPERPFHHTEVGIQTAPRGVGARRKDRNHG